MKGKWLKANVHNCQETQMVAHITNAVLSVCLYVQSVNVDTATANGSILIFFQSQ